MYYEHTFTIDSRDLDCFTFCRTSALLGMLQDAAALAAAEMQADGPNMLAKYRQIWMLARLHLELDAPLHWQDRLTVKTWHRGGDKAIMYRDFDLLVNGRKAGEALHAWVLADLDTRSLSRFDRFPEFRGTDGGPLIRATHIPRVKLPEALSPLEERTLHYSDTDQNGHVNNTRYADFFCDALDLASSPAGTFVRALQLDYRKECRAGERLCLSGAARGDDRYVLAADPAGEPRFQGHLTLGRA